jgi:hypothetical protein
MRLHLADLALAALVSAGCNNPIAPAPPPPAAVMLGEWSYVSPAVVCDAPSLNAGLHVTIAIDSLDGMRFWGRVVLWFAGDVGISPGRFAPVTGSVDRSGGVRVLIAFADPGASSVTIVGVLAGDTLTVSESWLGAEAGPFPTGGCFDRTLHQS